MKIAVLYRALDPRFSGNFAQDVYNREDESYRASIVAALRENGHDACDFQVREDHLEELQRLDCDLAFNLVDDGPAILDVFGIPYTGCDFLALATTLDKARTKEILGYHGVATPAFQIFASADDQLRADLGYPLIVKPLHEDASIGVFRDSVVGDDPSLRLRVADLVEEYIDGRELSVGVIERDAKRFVTPMNEVVFNVPPGAPRVYSYVGKWDPDSDEYKAIIPDQCPPLEPLPEGVEEEIRRVSLRCFDLLRLRGYARVDFRLRADGKPFILEVNANPLIGEYSVMATMAERMGWLFPEFIQTIAVEAHRQSRHGTRAMTLRKHSC